MDTAHPNSSHPQYQIGIVQYGDAEKRRSLTPSTSKVPSVFPALAAQDMVGVPVAHNDEAHDEVRAELLRMDGVLVWVNPIEDGHDRTRLDALLREVAAAGVFVSTHPDVILKLGTKQVLVDTRSLGWSAPGTRLHRSPVELRASLVAQLAAGEVRVLKQYRGHSGQGIWKVEPDAATGLLRVREAPRGSPEMLLSIDAFVARCADYFHGEGRMIDQPYQSRLSEGMIRCYLVQDRVEGFGHQAVNALCPAPPGAPRDAFPPTTPRLYHPGHKPEFQALKRQLEDEWVPGLQALLGLAVRNLPLLWDCDFLLGEKTASGEDSYVLCEINVSSVSPFPESALEPLVRAVRLRVDEGRRERGS